MSLILWTQRTTHILLPIDLTNRDGTALDLSSVTASAVKPRMRLKPNGAWTTLGATVVIIAPASNGAITLAFTAADVAVKGLYRLKIEVDFTSDVWVAFEQDFSIV